MVFIKTFISHVLKKPSLYLFVFFIVFTSDRYSRWSVWKSEAEGLFYDDIEEYYHILPSAFIHHNFSEGKELSAIDNYVIHRRTLGMAIMYSPFFFASDLVAKNYGYSRDGYSLPYR